MTLKLVTTTQMFAEPFEGKDGYRIWLDLEKTDELLATANSREERIASGELDSTGILPNKLNSHNILFGKNRAINPFHRFRSHPGGIQMGRIRRRRRCLVKSQE